MSLCDRESRCYVWRHSARARSNPGFERYPCPYQLELKEVSPEPCPTSMHCTPGHSFTFVPGERAHIPGDPVVV